VNKQEFSASSWRSNQDYRRNSEVYMRVTNKEIYSKFKSPNIKTALKVHRLKLLENVVNTGGTESGKKVTGR
jgi:hypothetical protein